MLDEILDEGPKMPKPPSPKLDPRSGLSYAQQQALHIDHGPPLPPEPEPYNTGPMDHGMPPGIPPIPGNPFLPPNEFEQTPSDYSYSTANHSDQGYLSGTSGSSFSQDNFGRNQFQNNSQFGGTPGFGGGNQGGHFDFNNRSQIPPPQSPFVKPGFGSTPMSYDSSMSQQTPITPQTPQPLMQNEGQPFDNRDRGGRNRDRRDRDRGSNSKFQDFDRNKSRNSDWNRDRDRFNRDSRDRDKSRRDWKYERDNEYNRRERDRERDRNRNSDRDRRRNDFREPRIDEREKSREKIVEKEIPKEEPFVPEPPPPVFTPKPAEPKEEDEPRSMSLESRIQSLLSGFRSPEPAKPPKEETPPPVTPKSSKAPPLPPSEDAQSGFEKLDTVSDSKVQNSYIDNKTPVYNETPAYNQTPLYNEYSNPTASVSYHGSTPSHDSNQAWSSNYPNGTLPVNSVQPPQDDEDRMSLDSNDSGGGNTSIEINPQAMKPDVPVVPPPLMSIPTSFNSNLQQPPWPQSSANSFDMGNFSHTQNTGIDTFNYMGGTFNQNYINQYNNDLNNMENEEELEEEHEKTEVTFCSVLDDFVQELKEILSKDLCKKMVENSGFKYYDRWWDREEEKTKVSISTVKVQIKSGF